MTATLAIYDLDEVYANSLMKYINQKQNMPFKATAFTNKEALEEYLQDNHIDILLVDYNLYDEYLELEDVSKIIFLVEDVSSSRIILIFINSNHLKISLEKFWIILPS